MEAIKASITGIGINSPFGNTLERFWQSVFWGEGPLKESSFYHFSHEDETSDWYEKNFLIIKIKSWLIHIMNMIY